MLEETFLFFTLNFCVTQGIKLGPVTTKSMYEFQSLHTEENS